MMVRKTLWLFAFVAAAGTLQAQTKDPRVGLKPGLYDAETAFWNMRMISTTAAPDSFKRSTNSDLAFINNYVVQGNYNGYMVWDISNPASPKLRKGYYCPASQSDVSVYKNLLFVSGEGLSGRIDCAGGGVQDTVSKVRLRGLRVFDVSDWDNPKNVANVQTCRGSHTHTLVEDPKDKENVYVYISGSAPVRSPNELEGCSAAQPESDPNSALFRIEVIKIPLAHPEQAAIVSSPRIFNDLKRAPGHGESPVDTAQISKTLRDARARGAFIANIFGSDRVLPNRMVNPMLDSIAKTHGGTLATATPADSAALRGSIQGIVDRLFGSGNANRGPTQCHDITVYPAKGLAGGACEGYGMLIDISDPAHPVRLTAVADSNFSYWHSATFNNDATKILFSDEWGGGGGPKCREGDPAQWGADAL
ncbi:MAG TPA: hypothetical protein VM100_05645, partial [Longimicrobiales bacterium]|nr:hypothetical protein [Longimicrobiales bacterium]